ncbi:MAG: DUF3592 domain-containing protein [Planctomycetes bacterium]|nr:DUF3592 domain-containing protein [Planctomycetota bacterium]
MTQEGHPAGSRRAEPSRRTRMLCLALAALPLLFAGFMLYEYLTLDDHARLSRANCLLLAARVVNKGRGLEKRGGMQFPVYLVRYDFNFEGRRVEGRGRVSREWHNWLERGGEVEVYVDASDPQRNFLELEYDFRVGRVLRRACLAAGAGVALIIPAIFPGMLPAADRRRRPRDKTGTGGAPAP